MYRVHINSSMIFTDYYGLQWYGNYIYNLICCQNTCSCIVASFPGLPRLQFFDRLQYAKTEEEGLVNLTYMTSQILDMKAYCKQSKTGAGEGLGTRLAACSTSYLAVQQ